MRSDDFFVWFALSEQRQHPQGQAGWGGVGAARARATEGARDERSGGGPPGRRRRRGGPLSRAPARLPSRLRSRVAAALAAERCRRPSSEFSRLLATR